MDGTIDGTAQLLESDRRFLVHPLHHPEDHKAPMLVTEGRGAMLHLADGREVIDGLAGLWNVNVGHGREELAQAAAQQMSELAYFSGYVGSSNKRQIGYTAMNTAVTPGPGSVQLVMEVNFSAPITRTVS